MVKKIKRFLIFIIVLTLIPVLINFYVIFSGNNHIVDEKDPILANEEIQCILVLGAGITADGKPSPMLRDRLDVAISLYEKDLAPRLLLSGDHGKQYYDEVKVMYNYCMEKDIPPEDIFLDHAGFSTYDSMVRAKEIFQVENMIVVTQKYHLYRALFIGEKLGLEVYGVSASLMNYHGQIEREKREFLARNKDFLQTLSWPDPRFLGDIIPITGDAILTHDL